MKVKFFKYQALLNDYIIVDRIKQNELPNFSDDEIRFLCNRRAGIGADGILELTFDEKNSFYKMKIINSDASVAKMCGNGLRCIVKFLHDSSRIKLNEEVKIITDAGLKSGTILDNNTSSSTVSVNLGKTQVLQTNMLFDGLNFTMVDVGNPHIVTFLDKNANLEDFALTEGKKLETAIEGGVNVGFAKITDNNTIELAVWERGAGFTMACGTGATAATTAAINLDLLPSFKTINVLQSGGNLEISASSDMEITLKGSSNYVFDGNIQLCF